MNPPTAPLVGSGDPVNGSEWVVESSTSILSREPWLEVFEEHVRLPLVPVQEQTRARVRALLGTLGLVPGVAHVAA